MLSVLLTQCDLRIWVTEKIVRRDGLHSLKFRGTAKALCVKRHVLQTRAT
jgi:hypothetical protein